MMGLLAIVFLAALVGLVKPYAGNLSRKHFGLIAFFSFVGMMIVVPKPAANAAAEPASRSVRNDAPTGDVSPKVVPTPAAETETKWSYSESKDEMRGTTSRYASITSENEVDLDFPYGEQRGQITIRRNPESGLNVMFAVGNGQILCNSFTNTQIAVKFDDGPVRKMGCTDASDGSSETVFFTNEGSILAGLKKAKRTIIEAEFFQKGHQQFIFETAGLKWN